jgi:hypothetical protein
MGNADRRGIGRVEAAPELGVVVSRAATILKVVVEPRAVATGKRVPGCDRLGVSRRNTRELRERLAHPTRC